MATAVLRHSEAELLELAKKHWDKEDDATFKPPAEYLDDLRWHLTFLPNDDHFVLTPGQTSDSNGIVTCLEDACCLDIDLDHRHTAPTSVDGIGSLRKFQEHILSSQAHRDARDKRCPKVVSTPVAQAAPVPKAFSKITDAFGIKPSPTPPVRRRPLTPSSSSHSRFEDNGQPSSSVKSSSGAGVLSSFGLNTDDAKPKIVPSRSDSNIPPSSGSGSSQSLPQSKLKDKRKSVTGSEDGNVKEEKKKQKIEADEKEASKKRKEKARRQSSRPRFEEERSEDDAEADSDEYDSDDERRAAIFSAGSMLSKGSGGGAGAYIDDAAFHAAISSGGDFIDNATVAEARHALSLPANDKQACINGMVTPLKPHQHLGVAWMINQEKSRHSGGFLCDDMGLGKTMQTIALAVARQSRDPQRKTNLIIVPKALLHQWRTEIESHVEEALFSIHIYWGEDKITKVKKLQQFDVILTTYETMLLDFPDPKKVNVIGNTGGPLCRMKFYRVVLDEAQRIRNRRTRASLAVALLKSRYRWCLTGTPITNKLEDTYPLMRFVGIRPYDDWSIFNQEIAKAPDQGPSRLQAFLRGCMLRRLKTSELDGKRLIELDSKKDIKDAPLTLSPDEQSVYNLVFENAQGVVSKYLKAGTVLKNYANVLVQLLRLRQICGHPYLVMEHIEAIVDADDAARRTAATNKSELFRAQADLGYDLVAQWRQKYLLETQRIMRAEAAGDDFAATDSDCYICTDPLAATSVVTACGHEFCRECIDERIDSDIDANDGDLSAATCPACRQPVKKTMLYLRSAFMPAEDPPIMAAKHEPGSSQIKVKSAPGELDEDLPDASTIVGIVDAKPNTMNQTLRERFNALPPITKDCSSTKLQYMLDYLERIKIESPDEKVLVLSQFVQLLDICDDFLTNLKYRVVRFQGDMTLDERAESVHQFATNRRVMVMLMSTKAGGVGLNLTCANHVVNLDLAWSPAVEAQAYDRTHRLGQRRDVWIKRPIIVESVEDRIKVLQEKKARLSDDSLGEGSGKKLGRLTVAEIASLFNLPPSGLPNGLPSRLPSGLPR